MEKISPYLPPGQDAWNFQNTGFTFVPPFFLLVSLSLRGPKL